MQRIKKKQHVFYAGNWPLAQGRPNLILIHGAGQSALKWEEQVDALAPIANTLAVDLPGHGGSELPGCNAIGAYAGYVSSFIGDVCPTQVVICGHSMGGAIAQHLLIENDQRIKAGILVNTGARLRVHRDLLEMIQKDYLQAANLVFQWGFGSATQTAAMRKRFTMICQCSAQTAFDDYTACNAFDKTHDLSAIRCRVLVIGSANDLMTPLKYAAYLAEKIPHGTLRVIADAGHHAGLENPGQFNKDLTDFLQSLP